MQRFTRRALGRSILAGAAASALGRASGQNCAPPSGIAVDFVIPQRQNIQRKAVAELDDSEVARLRLAYQKLRELTTSDANDPRGWMQQANVHCWNCGGGSGADIHGSWTFLPWHRAFLYFHERILATLLNDDAFRLPYWSWDDINYRNFPDIYRPDQANGAANSLYDANRSSDASTGKPIPSSYFSPDPVMAANFEAFGGDTDSAGSLEASLHGAIHMWTGTAKVPNADMGNLWLAGRDPVFYAHHCNIDRLWAEFNRLNPVAHANPTAAEFLTHSFQFFDENKQLVTIKVQDVLDPAPLGFSYAPGAGLSKSEQPKWTKLNYNPTTRLIRLPDSLRGLLTSAIVRERSLVLKNVKLPMNSGSYNIYVGTNYVGYIGLITSAHMSNHKGSLALNVTDAFLQSAGGTGARLTYAPVGKSGSTPLDFSAIYLTEE